MSVVVRVPLYLPWTDGRSAQSVGFDVWNATWSTAAAPSSPLPAAARRPPARLPARCWTAGPRHRRPGSGGGRRCAAAGPGSGAGTRPRPREAQTRGAAGSSIGWADRTTTRPGCCPGPECPGLLRKGKEMILTLGFRVQIQVKYTKFKNV